MSFFMIKNGLFPKKQPDFFLQIVKCVFHKLALCGYCFHNWVFKLYPIERGTSKSDGRSGAGQLSRNTPWYHGIIMPKSIPIFLL